jgi:uncharacterized protein YfeS
MVSRQDGSDGSDRPQVSARTRFVLAYSTYGEYGSNAVLGGVETILGAWARSATFGDVRELAVELCFEKSAESRRRPEYRAWLESLPKVVWRKKTGILKVQHRVEHLDAGFVRVRGGDEALTPARFRGVVEELQIALERVRPRLERRRILDFEGVKSVLQRALDLCRARADVLVEMLRDARVDAVPDDPWAGLEIEWAHEDARRLMDDPFFWSPIDELAPFGNDTGADVLEDYRRWARRRAPSTGLEMLRTLLQEWGTADDDAATIPLAFAQIAVHGAVDAGVRRAAGRAIEQRRAAADRLVSSEHVASLRAALDRLQRTLEAASETTA